VARNTAGLRRGGPGRPKGAKNKVNVDRDLLVRMAEKLDSDEYLQNVWSRMLRGRAAHMETYFATRIKGKADDHLKVEGDLVLRWQGE
jgi:hypothetical protein